jgi:hypothetical protein
LLGSRNLKLAKRGQLDQIIHRHTLDRLPRFPPRAETSLDHVRAKSRLPE